MRDSTRIASKPDVRTGVTAQEDLPVLASAPEPMRYACKTCGGEWAEYHQAGQHVCPCPCVVSWRE
jgi:hypothetical protein